MLISLKPGHKAVRDYYAELGQLLAAGAHHEGAVAPAFARLLGHCAQQVHWQLVEQYPLQRKGRQLRLDGMLIDTFNLPCGAWEAKDTDDDLPTEAHKKLDAGYPHDNILFQAPDRAILYQDGSLALDQDISRPEALVAVLNAFFGWRAPAIELFHQAVAEFKLKVPELGRGLLTLIETERCDNRQFVAAFSVFYDLCRGLINPNLSPNAVEEMLIQHILTERLFRTIFQNPDFVARNAIARELEKVVVALTSRRFSRHDFLRPLDPFYTAIEGTAATLEDYREKQGFLNTVYESFFQGFSVKVADTHGIVYTPQPIVDFMVKSVAELLRTEFGRELGDPGVHVLDPFVGTGNFIVRIMREIPKTRLAHKYLHELHCNEVMLLPYYIAAMNIEHAYFELTGEYRAFPGLCLADTFELAEDRQLELWTAENTERVRRQKAAPIFVIIANPPYNRQQLNENDNNKNRRYPVVDQRVAETYAADSKATLKNPLSDPYVKAFRWASDRIGKKGEGVWTSTRVGQEGVVAYVSNNNFVDSVSFDGMRDHLTRDFARVYHLDLGGNVRRNPKLSGTTHNVFGIQVGVGISLLVRKARKGHPKAATVQYARVGQEWRKERKYAYLEQHGDCRQIPWRELQPDDQHTWLTDDLHCEFNAFLPIGLNAQRGDRDPHCLFSLFSHGANSSRDAWVWNSRAEEVEKNVRRTMDVYNDHAVRWQHLTGEKRVDTFVAYDDHRISWSETMKRHLQTGRLARFSARAMRLAMYRPFAVRHLFFDPLVIDRQGHFPHIFPTRKTEAHNRVICLSGKGSTKPFHALAAAKTVCFDLLEKTQCFPFYVYDEDGTNRRENITDWALAEFRQHYGDQTISKWDIFHYVYGLLHHPGYRTKYAANLRRELPRLPYAPDFRAFAQAGARLAELHVRYEEQPEHPLARRETPGKPLDWCVVKMRLSKDKRSLRYNDFLTLDGIPPEVFAYRLGNRSALEWVIDQYQVTTDKRSGIVNDPNQRDDPDYIVRLLGKVITVSLETVTLVNALPAFE